MSLFVSPAFRASDANGVLPGATWTFYTTGTTTPASVYTTSALNVAHPNPVVADAAGLFPQIYLDPAVTYRAILKTAAGVTEADIDPISDAVATLKGSSGSSNVGFIQSGGVARTVQDRLRETVSVKDFGVAGDGSDETTKIQSALNSGATRVVFPAGSYGATALTVPSGVDIIGTGLGTKFVPLDNTSVMFTLNGLNRVSGFQVLPVTQRTGGTIFKAAGNEIYIDHFKATKCFRVVDYTGAYSLLYVTDCQLRDNNNSNTAELILINLTSGGSATLGNILADNNAVTYPFAGIRIRAAGDVLFFGEINLIHCGTDLLIDPPTGSVVASVFGGHLYLDTAVTGLSLNTSAGGSIVRCSFAGIESNSHSNSCVVLNATAGLISGVHIGYLETHLGSTDGVTASGANMSGVVINVHKAGGNPNGAAMSVGTSTSGITVNRAAYGNVDGVGSANKYGLFLGTGAGITVQSGIITGNTTANVIGDTTNVTIRQVSGVVTRNSGSGTLASAGTSIAVNHGLAFTPSANSIQFWATSNQGSTPLWLDTSTITSTQFTVKTTSAAAANITFGWEATCLGG